jgi:hypothetical protein
MKKLDEWKILWTDAVSKKEPLTEKAKRRTELYKGLAQPIDPVTKLPAKKKADCKRNMCFELIETQINNAIPAPKVTPRDPDNADLATEVEGYLQEEMDRLSSEENNDKAERGTLKQGSAFYLVGWDETKNTPTTSGELFVKYIPFKNVFPQPGIADIKEAEYVFIRELVSVKKLKEVYKKTVDECADFKGMNYLITVYYYSKSGNISRLGWIEGTDQIIFDEEDYELRKIKVCKSCGEEMHNHDKCPLCGDNKYEYVTQEMEVLPEDLVSGDPNVKGSMKVIAKAGTSIPYYKIKQLPFVMRKNISDDEDLYGVSDVDLLESNQISMNKILTKMEENVLKAGSIVTAPVGVNIPNTDETLKVVKVKDPNQMKAFSVQAIQANMQQDNILQEQFYQMGRDSIGITDSYQGKRDTTAESGKAKQVSAAQAAGRMESKRRMKDAAYADLYQLMFKFLLAYCDEPRVFARRKPDGTYVKGKFSRYNFLKQDQNGNLYYDDRFLFSVDDASTLATNRTAMWQETTNNFVSGTLGNPADPQTLLLYWNIMKGLNYPLAKMAIDSLTERAQQLPFELQQVIMQNPEILQTVQDVIANPEKYNETGGEDSGVQNNK